MEAEAVKNTEGGARDSLNITEGIIVKEDIVKGGVGWEPYLEYIQFVGTGIEIIGLVLLLVLAQVYFLRLFL